MPARPRTVHRLLARTLGLAVFALVALAAPAGADPAGPTDFRSEVTRITPDAPGVDARVRGGDSFLELAVAPGTEVVVFDYTSGLRRPYLRFLPDGTVERNRWSPATYLNEDRTGQGVVPEGATDPDRAPEWEPVADGGVYAWHDHRMHWMRDADPQGVARGERVGGEYDPWRIPIEVDGTAATIEGTLTFERAVSPVPPALAALGVAAAVALVGRRAPVVVAAGALTLVAGTAVVVGRGEWAATPDGGGNPLLWLLPLASVAAAIGALALARRSQGVVLTLAAVAGVSGWALLRLQVLAKPVLPTELPFALDRGTTAAALGVAVAAAYLAVSSGALRLPELAEDDPPA